MGQNKNIRHNAFQKVVNEYHPFATYEGYYKQGKTFYVAYRGNGPTRLMVIEGDPAKYDDCYLVADETLGTKRSLEIIEALRQLYVAFS